MTNPQPPPEDQDGAAWLEALAASAATAAALDLIVLKYADYADRVQHWLVEHYVRALLQTTGLPQDEWHDRARQLLTQLHRRLGRSVVLSVDQALAGAAQDIAEALAGMTNTPDASTKAGQTIAHLREAWRFGIRGMTAQLQQTLAKSAADLRNGRLTLPQAVHQAAKQFVDRDVHCLYDSAGRRWQPATYTEMSLRTAATSAHATSSINAAAELGSRFVMVSDTHRECDRCRPFEHKILTITGPATPPAIATLADAHARGLQHPHCRHMIYVWMPEYDDVPPPAEANPRLYEASQQQRSIERRIRSAKLDHTIDQAAGSPADAARSQAKVTDLQAQLRDHLAKHPELRRAAWREQPRPGDYPT